MKQNSRLQPTQSQEQSAAATHAAQQNTSHGAAEFASPEALLRHDASQTPVPSGVAARLRTSIAAEPGKPAGWWRRILGR